MVWPGIDRPRPGRGGGRDEGDEGARQALRPRGGRGAEDATQRTIVVLGNPHEGMGGPGSVRAGIEGGDMGEQGAHTT